MVLEPRFMAFNQLSRSIHHAFHEVPTTLTVGLCRLSYMADYCCITRNSFVALSRNIWGISACDEHMTLASQYPCGVNTEL